LPNLVEALEAKHRTQAKAAKKRPSGITAARKKYMEARRLATAALRKEKKGIEADIKAQLAKMKRGTKTNKRKQLVADLKKKWTHFREKYPHYKKVKTVASLRRLAVSVAAHRLKS
jgi:hypothetical protein